uniref:Lipoprotein n=1 Tax=viral metagenome TaxID=1070528 RepID=A0A6M3KCZ0_9ZZZZ
MKKLLVMLAIVVFMFSSCATIGKNTTKGLNKKYTVTQIPFNNVPIKLYLPNDVPDIVSMYSENMAVQRLSNTVCVLIFSTGNDLDQYQLVVRCNEAEFLILIEFIKGNERFWIYNKGYPIVSSKEAVVKFLKMIFEDEKDKSDKKIIL